MGREGCEPARTQTHRLISFRTEQSLHVLAISKTTWGRILFCASNIILGPRGYPCSCLVSRHRSFQGRRQLLFVGRQNDEVALVLRLVLPVLQKLLPILIAEIDILLGAAPSSHMIEHPSIFNTEWTSHEEKSSPAVIQDTRSGPTYHAGRTAFIIIGIL